MLQRNAGAYPLLAMVDPPVEVLPGHEIDPPDAVGVLAGFVAVDSPAPLTPPVATDAAGATDMPAVPAKKPTSKAAASAAVEEA